jgi:hypothetical protein
MPETMRAFVIKKVGETAVVEKPIPNPAPRRPSSGRRPP